LKTYKLKFGRKALKAWNDLDTGLRRQFEKKLSKVVQNPHIPSARLHGYENSYRIKLRRAGYRLGYRVFDAEIVVLVVAVGRRDKDEVYEDFHINYNEGF
jgi:mRNA interferase RelE/StbE